jgi:hypothetical protein
MAWRLGLGACVVSWAACGARTTLDYGEFADGGVSESGGAPGTGRGGFGGSRPPSGGGAFPTPNPGVLGGTGTGATGTGGPYGGAGGAYGGAAGAPPGCAEPPAGGVRNPLLDDMEDGDMNVLPYDGRSGSWYGYGDMNGVQTGPTNVRLFPPRDASRRAMYTVGRGFSSWGAGIGFVLNGSCPYDASAYRGIRFRAWAGFAIDLGLRVNLNTAAITPLEFGGSCSAQCWDSHGMDVVVYDEWGLYTIAFSELRQLGLGKAVRFDPSQLMAVNFQVGPYPEFQLWIDDVEFY